MKTNAELLDAFAAAAVAAADLQAQPETDVRLAAARAELEQSLSAATPVPQAVEAAVPDKLTRAVSRAYALCPSHLSHPEKMLWQARYILNNAELSRPQEVAAPVGNCGLSWNGFNVWGDEKSINEVKLGIHAVASINIGNRS